MAVESGLFDLYEIENGKWRLTGASRKLIGGKRRPVKDYLETQGRFKSLSEKRIDKIQKEIDAKWDGYEQALGAQKDIAGPDAE
jgi:pyruvate ferredoxin oxidoreductase beta subunit